MGENALRLTRVPPGKCFRADIPGRGIFPPQKICHTAIFGNFAI